MGRCVLDVAFCYPSRVAGGAELLFFKCARYLAGLGRYNVSYVDYDDGFAYRYVSENESINHISYTDNCAVDIKENTIVIIPLSYIPIINNYLVRPERLKYLIWSINPYNLVSYMDLHRQQLFTASERKRTRIGEGLKELSEKGIIRYMDYNNYYWNSSVFNFSLRKICYLPIVVDDIVAPDMKDKSFGFKELSFVWLGRLDVDKYHTILTFLNELESLSSSYKITLYIVGVGNKEKTLRKKCEKMVTKVVFIGKLFGEELKEFIVDNVDIGLAMGTSALDIAKMGKPVIVEGVLDHTYKVGKRKDYVLVSEIKNYDVVSPGYYDKNLGHGFNDLICRILNDYKTCAYMCYSYVKQRHSEPFVMGKIEAAIKKAYNNYDIDCFFKLMDIGDRINKVSVDNHLKYKLIRKLMDF